MLQGNNDAASALFKRVPEGWLFRGPNPWVFGDAPHYVVTDTQKEVISAILKIRRPVVAVLVLIAGLAAWIAAAAFLASILGSANGPATASDFTLLTVLCLLPVVGALPLMGFIQRKRLAPALAGIPETSQRIQLAEISDKLTRATSVKQIRMAFFASVFAAAAQGYYLWSHLARHRFAVDPQAIFTMGLLVIWLGVAIVWLVRWRRKAASVDSPAQAPLH